MAGSKRVSDVIMVVVCLCVTSCAADYDPSKCTLGQPSAPGIPDPTFDDNFNVYMERKDFGGFGSLHDMGSTVTNIDLWFSRSAGKARFHSRNAYNTTDYWMSAKDDQYMRAVVSPSGVGDCQAGTLYGSPGALFMMVTGNGSSLALGYPSEVMQFSRGSMNRVYIGKDFLQERGIYIDHWQSCQYFKETDSSMKVDYFFSDPTMMKMPSSNNGLLVSAETTGHSNRLNSDFHFRYDFSHNFYNLDPSTSEHLETPTELYCANAAVTLNLPKIPDYFRYKGEQVTIFSGDGSQPVVLNYFQETYMKALGLFIIENEAVPTDPNSPNDVSYYRQVSDFNTGIMYTMDLKAGNCHRSNINIDNNAAFPIANGKVQMKTSSQFFDLDSHQYQYMGVHQHKSRGIQGDAYTVFFPLTDPVSSRRDSMFTWYFASKAWQTKYGYNTAFTQPLTLRVETSQQTVAQSIFEWSTSLDQTLPDISICQDANTAIPVEMYFSGRYDQVVTPDPLAFQSTLLLSVMATSGLVSPLRVSNIDVQPASMNQIVVRFLLLDRPPTQGNVKFPYNETSATDCLAQLTSSVNSGQFIMQVLRSGNAGSVQVKASAVGQFDRGQFHGSRVQISSSQPYHTGDMAGIGIGMFIFGLVLGVAGIFVFRKMRGGGRSSGGGIDTGMDKFGGS